MLTVGAVILAAGESARLGRPKQLIQFRGKSLLRRIIDAADEAGCSPIAVVIGSDAKKMVPELEGTAADIVGNENWRNGIGTSIRAGMQNLVERGRDLDAVILLVSDQPLVEKELIEQTLGIPAIFGRAHFKDLFTLRDDSGAKSIILSKRECVVEFPFPQGEIDIDTLADYERLVAQL